jgi:hypothetical protein
MTLPATVDRANPNHVRIEWDELPDARDRARQTAEGLAAAMRTAQPPPPTPQPPASDSFDERMNRLERLAKLHADGALTDEEFAEQKRRLLDL